MADISNLLVGDALQSNVDPLQQGINMFSAIQRARMIYPLAQLKANPLYNLPSGSIGQAIGLKLLQNSDPDSYGLAHTLINDQLIAQGARTNYYDALAKSMGYRYLPTIGKEQGLAQTEKEGHTAGDIAKNPSYLYGQGNIPVNTQPIVGPPIQNQLSQVQQNQSSQVEGMPQNTQMGTQNPNAQKEYEQIQSAIMKSTTPTNELQQRVAIRTAMNTFNELAKYIPSVAKFSQLQGSARQILDKAQSAAGGKDDPDYDNLVNFMSKVPLLINEIRKATGGQATDAETKLYKEVALPDFLATHTTKQVLLIFNSMKTFLERNAAALQGNNYQNLQYVKKIANESKEAPDNLPSYTMNSSNYRNMTADDLKNLYGMVK